MGRVLIAAGIVGLLAAMLTTLVCGVPVPQVHDEFSYLLAGDTYAHGRLTNPPHPMWPWLETFYVLQQPTYMSRYPPGQGLFLALGFLIGLPVAGVWLSAALACAALTWMLLAWLPERWALAGGALAALHPLMLAWSHSYWGGAAALLGGALTFGAAARVAAAASAAGGRSARRYTFLLGLGIVILALTRPWEGGVLALLLLAVGGAMRMIPWKSLAPAALVVIAGLAFIAYDDWRVTGHPLLLPHVLYGRQYGTTPPLIWQSTHAVVYRHKEMERVSTGWDLDLYRARRTPFGLLMLVPSTLSTYAGAAFGFLPDRMIVRTMSPTVGMTLTIVGLLQELLLAAPLLFIVPALRRDRSLRAVAIVACGVFLVALVPSVFPLPHYAAPIAPALALFWLIGLRERPKWAIAAAALWLAGGALFLIDQYRYPYRSDEVPRRMAIARRLESEPGRQLVVVRYQPSHNPHFEWVENGADIDRAKIVWARDLPDDAPLLRYFADRKAWLLTVGDREAALASIGRSPAPAPRPPATPAAAAGR